MENLHVGLGVILVYSLNPLKLSVREPAGKFKPFHRLAVICIKIQIAMKVRIDLFIQNKPKSTHELIYGIVWLLRIIIWTFLKRNRFVMPFVEDKPAFLCDRILLHPAIKVFRLEATDSL